MPRESSASPHHAADQVDGITVDQIKRLMLCFASRPNKAYFSRYTSSASLSSVAATASESKLQDRTTTSDVSSSAFAQKESSDAFGKQVVGGFSDDDEDEDHDGNVGGGQNNSSSNDNNHGPKKKKKKNKDDPISQLIDTNSASMFNNVKLKPLNRAVFIERVKAVLPDRPDSVINSWFSQLDTDRVGLVTWSNFSTFLLFRSATVEAAGAKLAEFHPNCDAPLTIPPAVVRHFEPATCMLVNPKTGDLLTAGADGVINAWHPQTLEPRGAALTLRSYVTSMELLDGGQKIAVSCMDRSVTIVDSRAMRVVRCFAGRSIPKHLESGEAARIIDFFEKRPDWVRIERGPRVLTAPPDVPSFSTILDNVRRGGTGGGSPLGGAGGSKGGDEGAGEQKEGGGAEQQQQQSNSSGVIRKHGGSPGRPQQPHSARHVDRPWVQGAGAGGGGSSSSGGQQQHHSGDGGGGGSSTARGKSAGGDSMDEATAIGTYIVGEAAPARSDVGRRAEIHALLDLDNCPTCMCTFPFSQSAEEAKGRVSSGILGTDTSIESGEQFHPDPVLFGMPDGVIKQYNLPTMFPRATPPKATWRPHMDRVRMMRYIPEINGVLSCSDDGTLVMSHPDRRGHYRTSTSGAPDVIRQFRVPNTYGNMSIAGIGSSSSSSSNVSSGGGNNIFSSSITSGGTFSSTIAGGMMSANGSASRLTMAEQMRMKLGFTPVHKPAVVCFDFSAELKMVACCAYDRVAFLYDATQDTHSARLAGLSAPAISIAFNGVDNQVVVACADRTVRIYDTRHSDLPLQTLDRPAFNQFGHITSGGLLVNDRRIYIASNFPASYCSRSAFSEQQQKNAPPTGNKILQPGLGGKSLRRDTQQQQQHQRDGFTATATYAYNNSTNNSNNSNRNNNPYSSSSASAFPFFGGGGGGALSRRSGGSSNKATQLFHAAPVHVAFVDDVGISSGVLRLFTLCSQQMMCWALLSGDSMFSLNLPSTSTGRNHNRATCACASEGCLKVVVGYDDGSVVLWVPAVGEAAARLPDHETIHGRVRCTGVCYRRSFSVKQMIILASIDSALLFLAQGEPYTLQVVSQWQTTEELGPVTCVHELGISNSVLCGTQNGALIVLSLTTNEMEGGPMWASAKVAVSADRRKKKKNLQDPSHLNSDGDDNDSDVQQQQQGGGGGGGEDKATSSSTAGGDGAEATMVLEDNDFGRVESVVHYPAFGQNVYAVVHSNGDVVFWDCVHRVQLGALCIRGLQTSITHTVVKDFGSFQLIVYTDDLGNLFVRRLDFSVLGAGGGAGGGGDNSSHFSCRGAGGGDASGENSPNTQSLLFNRSHNHGGPPRIPLNPAVAFNVNSPLTPSPALVVAGTRHAAHGGISNACNIVAVYRAPWDDFRSAHHASHNNSKNSGLFDGAEGDEATASSSRLFDPTARRRKSSSAATSAAAAAAGGGRKKRKSTTFDGLGEQIDHNEVVQVPPEYVCVVSSNTTVNDTRVYCFEITDGYVCHVGSGGQAEWLAAPHKSDLSYCVDSEEWKLQMEASVSIAGLNPVSMSSHSVLDNVSNSSGDQSPTSKHLLQQQQHNNNNNNSSNPFAFDNLDDPSSLAAGRHHHHHHRSVSSAGGDERGGRESTTTTTTTTTATTTSTGQQSPHARGLTATKASSVSTAASTAPALLGSRSLLGRTSVANGKDDDNNNDTIIRLDIPKMQIEDTTTDSSGKTQPQQQQQQQQQQQHQDKTEAGESALQLQQMHSLQSPSFGSFNDVSHSHSRVATPHVGDGGSSNTAQLQQPPDTAGGGGGGRGRLVSFQEEDEEGALIRKKRESMEKQSEQQQQLKAKQQQQSLVAQQQLQQKEQQQQQQQQKQQHQQSRVDGGRGSKNGTRDSDEEPGRGGGGGGDDEAALLLRGDHIQQVLFHKPRPPKIGRSKIVSRVAGGQRHVDEVESVNAMTTDDDLRPLSLVVPRGHNDRTKKALRMTNMLKAEALEEIRMTKLASRRAATAASQAGSDGSGSASGTDQTTCLTPMNKFARAIRNAGSAISGLMTPIGFASSSSNKGGLMLSRTPITTTTVLGLSVTSATSNNNALLGASTFGFGASSSASGLFLSTPTGGSGGGAGGISALKRMATPNLHAATAAAGGKNRRGTGAGGAHAPTPLPVLMVPGEQEEKLMNMSTTTLMNASFTSNNNNNNNNNTVPLPIPVLHTSKDTHINHPEPAALAIPMPVISIGASVDEEGEESGRRTTSSATGGGGSNNSAPVISILDLSLESSGMANAADNAAAALKAAQQQEQQQQQQPFQNHVSTTPLPQQAPTPLPLLVVAGASVSSFPISAVSPAGRGYRPTPTPSAGIVASCTISSEDSTVSSNNATNISNNSSNSMMQLRDAAHPTRVNKLAPGAHLFVQTRETSPGGRSLSISSESFLEHQQPGVAGGSSNLLAVAAAGFMQHSLTATPALPDDIPAPVTAAPAASGGGASGVGVAGAAGGAATSFTQQFNMTSSLEELARRQLDHMRNRFKNFSTEIQEQVERTARKTDISGSGDGKGGADGSGGAGGGAKNSDGQQPLYGSGRSGSKALSHLLTDERSSKRTRLETEPLDTYEQADVLLTVLRDKRPLDMHRAMGIGGKTSIFGVLTPSWSLQEQWKEKSAAEERARLMEAQDGMEDVVVPRREEAGSAFSVPQMTQMRGRKGAVKSTTASSLEDSTSGGSSYTATSMSRDD